MERNLKPIAINPGSYSFADVPEGEQEALSKAFGIFDHYTDQGCVRASSLGDGKVTQDEFFSLTGITEQSFAKQGFSAARNLDFARFRDDFDYLPDFTTGKFVNVSHGGEATATEVDPASQGSEDVWSAFDKIWKEWEPVLGRAERIYDRSSAFTNAVAEINTVYVASGGQKNVMGPVLDIASRGARYYLEERSEDMMDNLVLPAIDENAQILDSDPSDGIDYDLSGLDSGEQAAVLSALEQCETKSASQDETESKAWGFGCTGFLFAYSLTLAYEDGLDKKLSAQYPLF